MTGWEAAFAKYVWIWIGLTVGLAAKYALLIKRGVRLKPILILADAMMLPLVALIAFSIIHRLGADGEVAALLTALCTVGADRLVKLTTDRFFREVETEIAVVAKRVRGDVVNNLQAEISGNRIIDDTISGKALDDYAALRRPTEDL